MTSPVDTSVKFFHSDMAGAPVLNGAAGRLIALLDACLVNGWGAVPATSLVVSGGVATVAFNGSFAGVAESVLLVSGVTGVLAGALNGEQKIIAVGTGTASFATAAPNGTAAGAISIKMAPGGFEKRFAGTNLAAYRSLDAGATKFHLRVNDTAAAFARVVGYETMTAISTGTNLFPTNAQLSGGGYWTKSYAANADPIPWIIFSNGKRFLIGIAWGATTAYGGPLATTMALQGFGDFVPWKSTVDAYRCMLLSSLNANEMFFSLGCASTQGVPASFAAARAFTGAVGAALLQTIGAFGGAVQAGSGETPVWGELPGATGQLILTQPVLFEADMKPGPRGVLPELYHTPQGLTQAAGIRRYDLVPGTGLAAGRKLMAIPCSTGPQDPTAVNYYPATFVDVTGPWE